MDNLYGKLELKELPKEEDSLEELKVLYTIENFDELKEFKIDKLYARVMQSIPREKLNEFSFQQVLAYAEDDIALQIVKFTKKNVIEAKETTHQRAFFMFLDVSFLLTSARNDLKKNV